PLGPEDQMVQSCGEASPTKWHRAHTTWFFETFILAPHARGYKPFSDAFRYLFNSYYNNVGERPERTTRGMISRPSTDEVRDYREHVDEHVQRLLEDVDVNEQVRTLVELGLNHEQQHQELIVTDIKHAFWTNPLRPAYQSGPFVADNSSAPAQKPHKHEEGVYEVGADEAEFHFDNESPRHRVYLQPYRFAIRPVTCGEYLAFMGAGG